MTLEDIARMMQITRVPHSKTVEVFYPDPCTVIHVPGSHYLTVCGVVQQMRKFGQTIKVTLLESRDVPAGKHVFVKVKHHVIESKTVAL